MGEAVSTTCERCTIEIAISAMQCPHCGSPGRYPNAIQASLEAEALNKRYEDALERAHSAATRPATERSQKAIDSSKAGICVKANEAQRQASAVHGWTGASYARLNLPPGLRHTQLKRSSRRFSWNAELRRRMMNTSKSTSVDRCLCGR